jgi:hypothetical protein
MQQLKDLISANADVELQLDDGTLMASSAVLSLFISVLRGSVEANAGAAAGSCSDGSGSSKEGSSIPLKGVTKKDWLQVAAFWYPSVPSPQIKGWFQAEKLLSFGIRFDIQLVLHKVSHRHMLTHLVDAEQPVNILLSCTMCLCLQTPISFLLYEVCGILRNVRLQDSMTAPPLPFVLLHSMQAKLGFG